MKPRHIFFPRLLSAFAVLAVSSLTSDAVLRHPDMTDAQALALAQLPQFDSKGRAVGCSASVLNSEWAVFAAHCIDLQDEQRVNFYYVVDGVSYTAPGTAYRTLSGDGGYDDVALIHFDAPLPAAVSWVAPYDRYDEFEQLGWQVGRGTSGVISETSTHISDNQFRAMTQRIISTTLENSGGEGASIIPQHIYYNYNQSPENDPPLAYTTRYEGGTGPGDSGGPLYIYSRGRFFNASVVSGPQSGSYRNGRLSTHLNAIVDRAGFEFAYPQAVKPLAVWVAEDLTASLADGSVVINWFDRSGQLDWSNATDGGTGAPQLSYAATPTGLAALQFDGADALGLSVAENVIGGQTSFSVAIVVRSSFEGEGLQVDPFGTTGLLDASSGGSGWGLSYSHNGRYGLNIEDRDASVDTVFRGGVDNNSLGDGAWHVIVATWDGSELSFDNAGDDRNMKLYVDTVDQVRKGQGAYHFDVARGAASLLLGDSQTNVLDGFKGDIAEVRFYAGELPMHEVDRLLSGLRARYVSGSLGVVFERPWDSQVSIEAGHGLITRGVLTGGGTSMTWSVESGQGAVTFSDAFSPDTEMQFDEVGTYVLRATVSDGVSSGYTDLTIEVLLPDAAAPSVAPNSVGGAWLSGDLGTVGVAGAFTESAGTMTLTGAGSGIGVGEGATYDEGHFVWKAVAGDFDWVARLDSLGDATGPTRAGLMVRGGAGPTDAAAFVGRAPDGTVYSLFRYDGGWYADLASGANLTTLPVWLKLERRGDTMTAYTSSDGLTYDAVSSGHEIKLPGVARAGLAVSSGNATMAVSADFSQIDLVTRSRAKASQVSLDKAIWSGAQFEAFTHLSGSDEPWLSVTSAPGAPLLDFKPTYQQERHVLAAPSSGAGAYQIRLAVDDGNTISFVERQETLRYFDRYEFAVDGDAEGWSGNNVNALGAIGGELSGTAATNDPQLILDELSLDGNGYTHLVIRMRASLASSVQVFWSHTEAGGFTSARSLTGNYATPGAYQTLVFELSGEPEWLGQEITNLRIDPLNGTVQDASFEIDYIEIFDGGVAPAAYPSFAFEQGAYLEKWSAPKDISGLRVQGGALKATATGIDPILTNDVDDFSSEGVSGLLVRLRASANSDVQFFWASLASPGFAGARSVTAAYTGKGLSQTLFFPLAGLAAWDGQVITNLRLDPSKSAGTDFAIEAIIFSQGDADGDSLPDAFESANGLDALFATDATQDADSDGIDNVGEYIAGTGLSDAGDRLQVASLSPRETSFTLTLSGKSGRLYRLLRKTDLAAPSWLEVDRAGSLPSDATVLLEDTERFDSAFYRVEVSLP